MKYAELDGEPAEVCRAIYEHYQIMVIIRLLLGAKSSYLLSYIKSIFMQTVYCNAAYNDNKLLTSASHEYFEIANSLLRFPICCISDLLFNK